MKIRTHFPTPILRCFTALTTLAFLTTSACGSSTEGQPSGAAGTGGSVGEGGAGGASEAKLPDTGIHFDADLDAGDYVETQTDVSEPELGEKETVEYPYDPNGPAEPDNGNPTRVEIRSTCTTKTYDIKSNPQKVLLHGVDNSITWPGALLQGAHYRDGSLRGLSLNGEHRAPLKVVIKDIYNNSDKSSSRTIDHPSFSSVTDGVSDIIVTANDDDLPLGGSVDYRFEETKDISRFMLKSHVSARYGIAKGSLSAGIDKSSSQHTIVINLVQKLFDVEVEEPPTAEAWFNDAFYRDGLQEKLDRGEISDDNPPVYVSKVTYGRMLTYTMSTTATSSDIRAMLKASVNTLAGGASLEVNARHDSIRENSSIAMVSIGGDQTAALEAAHTGNWGEFFKKDLKLTSAVPISMEFKNLYDNTPAGVTETGTYQEQICTPQIVTPGAFDFGIEDVHERPEAVGEIQQVVQGDFNGDGAEDLVWNHLVGADNNLYVGYGGDSHLAVDPSACAANKACDFSNDGTAWGEQRLLTGDFNGDGRDDLLWVPKEANLPDHGYTFYLLPAEDGGFAAKPTKLSVGSGEAIDAGARPPLVRDMNGDGAMDLVFTFLSVDGEMQRQDYQILLAQPGDSTSFSVLPRTEGVAHTDYDYPNTELSFDARDIDSDGNVDLLWGLLGQQFDGQASDERNVTLFQLNSPESPAEHFELGPVFLHDSPRGWSHYHALNGDFDGDGDIDRTFVRFDNGDQGVAVHQAVFDDASYTTGALQWWPASSPDAEVPWEARDVMHGSNLTLSTINVNGDGPDDVVATTFLHDKNGTDGPLVANVIAVMKGRANSEQGFFNVDLEVQKHPVVQDWSNFDRVFVGDFNGDHLDDLLWNNASRDNAVFIAYAKREMDD